MPSDPDIPPVSDAPVAGADHAERASGDLDRALALIRFLRANCPWDAKQTAESLVPHLIEETHEVVDAIHGGDDGELEGELGDLLLNLAFQIVVGEESGRFDADSVTRRIEAKMRRRHPHLYGLGPKEDWATLKAREAEEAEDDGRDGGEAGLLDGMPRSMDALSKAYRIQDRVAGVGFDWEDWRGALAKVREETEEVAAELDAAAAAPDGPAPAGPSPAELEEELGDLLFAVVNLVRLAGSHPVRALDRANRKFSGRFGAVERLARARGIEMREASLEELDEIWEEVKREARGQ